MDKSTSNWYYGGGGGDGGDGENSTAWVTCEQVSDAAVTAEVVDISNPPLNPAPLRDVNIDILIGWVSATNPDWFAAGGVWERNINMAIELPNGGTQITIAGGPAGTIAAWGVDDSGDPFWIGGSDALDGDTGTFGLAQGQIGLTQVVIGDTVTINAPMIRARLRGDMMFLLGGRGGDGGMPGFADGMGYTGGGAGGDGGISDEDQQYMMFGGGKGGRGEAGQGYNEFKSGFYEGYVDLNIL